MKKVMLGVLLGAVMAVSLAGCGNSKGGKSSADTSYTMWIYASADASYYAEYSDNPAVKYLFEKTWGQDNKKIDIEFWAPPTGTASDNYQTMIASRTYPDVLNGVLADSAPTLYEEEIILDLTDYVEQYMPNYKALLDNNPDVKSAAVYDVDGEERILSLTVGYEDYDYYFTGYEYRRDWIVKYGTNPQTGAAFSGGYTEAENPDSWADDVVFPSGGTDPIYISDWEWMFEIFEKAQADLGITDSYCISMYYPGYTYNGQLGSSFGGGNILWYKDDVGKIQFGGNTDSTRSYFQCLNTWYNNKWLDKEFNERTSDVFYSIDDVSVRQGKVGMWCGLAGQLGGRLDMGDEWTSGICVYGCALPVNDVYGPDSCKNVEPNSLTDASLAGVNFYITTAAKDKDLATLCSFFDYLYSEEGAIIRSVGLNEEQVAESNSTFYQDYGLDKGGYSIAEDSRYRYDDIIVNDSASLGGAIRADQLPGIHLISSVDTGFKESYDASMKRWIQYESTAYIGKQITGIMSKDDTTAINDIQTKILNYMEQKAPEFIKGIADPFNDQDWENWCTMLEKYNYQKGIDIYQPYINK